MWLVRVLYAYFKIVPSENGSESTERWGESF